MVLSVRTNPNYVFLARKLCPPALSDSLVRCGQLCRCVANASGDLPVYKQCKCFRFTYSVCLANQRARSCACSKLYLSEYQCRSFYRPLFLPLARPTPDARPHTEPVCRQGHPPRHRFRRRGKRSPFAAWVSSEQGVPAAEREDPKS